MAEQSINIPQVIVFAVVAFLVYRWYSSKPSANGTRPAAVRSVRINPAQIDTIAQMFPQLNRRDIAWDLQRNGGNAAATTERVLSGRPLDSAPASFQPPAAPTPAVTARPVAAAAKPSHPDLITRYNLSSKLSQQAEPTEDTSKAKAWSADRNERQSNLQRKREEMILAARRKMEEKERANASGTAA
ncbi:CUE domain-containing protein [Stagonosporopsis vannaccii]|nr:CUE domain-containing protein [Stagonosporopsis vannaccii]